MDLKTQSCNIPEYIKIFILFEAMTAKFNSASPNRDPHNFPFPVISAQTLQMGQNQTKIASDEEQVAAKALEDDEPDDWYG